MRKASKYGLRLAVGVVLFLALGGPAPGNVGGCGSTVDFADARTYCLDSEQWKCVRDQYAGRTTIEQRDACVAAIPNACSGFAWPDGCAPTVAEANACVALLMRADLASMTFEQLRANRDECNFCVTP